MRNIKCPDELLLFSHADFTKKLLNKFPENIFDNDFQDGILKSYIEYIKHRCHLEHLTPMQFECEIAKKLDDIYKRSRAELLKQWKTLLGDENIPTRCPSCGISTPSEAEHFLSRKQFREFSLFLLNLIPWCSVCNRKKSTKIVDSRGDRLFLNCYWDEIDKYCFWECNIDIIQNRVSFIVVKPVDCPDDLFKIVKSHAEILDLSNRFLKLGTEKLGEIIITIAECEELTMEGVVTNVKAQILAKTKTHGVNYWETVLFKGFLRNLNDATWAYIVSLKSKNMPTVKK